MRNIFRIFCVVFATSTVFAQTPMKYDNFTHQVFKPPVSAGSIYDYDFTGLSLHGISGGGGAPGGATGQFQFNAGGGTFGGMPTINTTGGAAVVIDADNVIFDQSGAATKKFHFNGVNVTAGQNRAVNIADATSTTVIPNTGAAKNYLTSIATTGVVSNAQPMFTDLSDFLTDTQSALQVKPSCVAVSITNIASLTGVPTMDGYATAAGDVVLLSAQTTPSQNGPWVVHSGAWTRPPWYQAGNTVQAIPRMQILVINGVTWAGMTFFCSSPTSGTITIDTTGTGWTNVQINVSGSTVANGVTGSNQVVLSGSPSIITPSFTTGFTIGGAAASRKIPVGNGTNFVASTETWAVPGTSGNVLTSDGTNWLSSAPATGGTVTHTGNLTANSVVLGNGTADTKVVAGIITDGTAKLTLGVNTATLGQLKLFGGTSGDATIQPAAIAGTATTVTLPNASSTLPIYPQQITYTGPTAARTVTYPDANFTVARTDAANTFIGASTTTSWNMTTPVITGGLTASGSGANDFSASTGGFSTSTGANTIGGAATFNNTIALGGTALNAGALPSGATTAGAIGTYAAQTTTVTGTNTATAYQENYHGVFTVTDSSAGTITDLFNENWFGPATVAGSAVATRKHTIGIQDSTNSTTSITGAFIVASTFGTAGSSIGMGAGNINAGNNVKAGGALQTTLGLQGTTPTGIFNFNQTNQTQITVSATEYYLTNSNLNMPATYSTAIAAGTTMKWRVAINKTGAGTGTFQVLFKKGTNGTTADATLATVTVGTQTAVADNMEFDATLTWTSTTAAYWSLIPHQSAASGTGFGLVYPAVAAQFNGTISGQTTTTASDKYGLSVLFTTGTPTFTVPMMQAQAFGVD